MIQLKLGSPRTADADDPMGRDWVGWTPQMSPQEIYDRNRGVWAFGARADRERYTVFTSVETGRVVAVVENDKVEDFGGKKAIIGRVLEAGNPVHDGLIGQPALDAFRNPMTYPEHPLDALRTCACGCGAEVTGARRFQPGHDQRAVHARITKEWGDVVGFIHWFDATYGAPETPKV
jgi:hypothetical protein